jgi:hypothetical protein
VHRNRYQAIDGRIQRVLLSPTRQELANGRRERFQRRDLLKLAATAGVKTAAANDMVDRVVEAVGKWPALAESAGIPEDTIAKVARSHLTGDRLHRHAL